MMSKRLFLVTTLFLVLALFATGLLSGCGEDGTEATTSSAGAGATAPSVTESPTPAGSFDGEILIGALASMTGAGAMGGTEAMWAQQKAIDDINAKGGVDVGGKKMQLKVKFIDDKSDANEAAAAVEKLAKVEGCKIILGTQTVSLTMAAAIVAEKLNVLYQQVTLWTSFAREQNYKWSPDLFLTPEAVGEVPFNMVDTAAESERPGKWSILTEDTNDGQGLGEGVKAMAAKHGYEVALYQTYTPGTKDYSSIILKMKESGTDAVVILATPADAITVAKQMKEQNYSPKYMMGWKGFWPTEFMQGLQKDSDYICFDGFWSEDLPFPGAKELGTAYREAHDDIDSVSIGLPYAAVQVVAMAIERAGSDDPAK
jgi:branched-chain amino acid transport system substrate-binding protein